MHFAIDCLHNYYYVGIPNHPQLMYTMAATHSEGQIVNIHWQEPDNANTYDLDYYVITVQPGNRVHRMKDTILSDNFNEGMYNVSIVVVNRCGHDSRGQPEHITIRVRAEAEAGGKLYACTTLV